LPFDVAITPDGKTAWVVNYTTVTPVATATGHPARPIKAALGTGDHANAIVISPDGTTAYVAASFAVIPVDLATRRAGKPILLGNHEWFQSIMVMTPDGRRLYVTPGGSLYPVTTATRTAGKPIRATGVVGALAMSPAGKTVYAGSVVGRPAAPVNAVVPISTATSKASKPIRIDAPGLLNAGVSSIAITPAGKTLYAATSTTVYPVNLVTRKTGRAMAPRGYQPSVIAISPDGKTAWVASINNNTPAGVLTPITIATNTPGKPIRVGADPVCLLVTTGHPATSPRQGSCTYIAR